jgi:hypothetical protein
MRFQFEQLERSLPEIEELFRALWICALHGHAVLAPCNAWLVGQGVVNITFHLQTHRCSFRAVARLDLGSAGALLGLEARKDPFCGHLEVYALTAVVVVLLPHLDNR